MSLLEITGLFYILGVAINSFYYGLATIFDRQFLVREMDFDRWSVLSRETVFVLAGQCSDTKKRGFDPHSTGMRGA